MHDAVVESNLISPPAPSILVVGRLIKSQQTEIVLEAISTLSSVTLTTLGDGPEQKKLESLCQRLGIERRVNFLRQSEYANAFMRAADAKVITSCSEDISYSLVKRFCVDARSFSRTAATPTNTFRQLIYSTS